MEILKYYCIFVNKKFYYVIKNYNNDKLNFIISIKLESDFINNKHFYIKTIEKSSIYFKIEQKDATFDARFFFILSNNLYKTDEQ
jgi:hypothetical protein